MLQNLQDGIDEDEDGNTRRVNIELDMEYYRAVERAEALLQQVVASNTPLGFDFWQEASDITDDLRGNLRIILNEASVFDPAANTTQLSASEWNARVDDILGDLDEVFDRFYD